MKVLHLYSNHKWTGPAELALQQVVVLNGHSGVQASLALAGHHDPKRDHAIEARAAELDVPLIKGLQLRRHFHPPSLARDIKRLAAWLHEGRFDLLHCHQPGDHLLAALALQRSRVHVPLIRSYWENDLPRRGPRSWIRFRRTNCFIAAFESQRGRLIRHTRLDPNRVIVIPPILGAASSTQSRDSARQSLREELGLEENTFLIGLTARIQPYRRWNLCWDVVQRLPEDTHLCVVGRADEGVFNRLCEQPLLGRGIRERVHFLGYRSGVAYFNALIAFDAFLFLVPGSDATCRALREAMACGLPVITTDAGYLPEIVENDKTGLVCRADADALACGLSKLQTDASLRRQLGQSAAGHAKAVWQTPRQADTLSTIYRRLLYGRAING